MIYYSYKEVTEMNNLINPLALGIVLKKYNLTPKNKEQIVLISKRKTATWSAIHRLARKLEFKQSVLDQHQQE
ncbi:hypothetical protein OA189_01910 [Prochlorococcus sp. AH-716-P20]|nr:hypothetical protein [Prochlorococcus sp. AH-716-P20]